MSERKEPTVSLALDTKDDVVEPKQRRANTQKARSYAKPPSSSKPSSGLAWFTLVLTLAIGGAAAYALWQLQTSQQMIAEQRSRIALLEDKLALSDDSANQSLATVGVKVRDLNSKVQKAASEIDKLWATRNVNRKAIKTNDKKLTALNKSFAALQQSSKALNASIASSSQSVAEQQLLVESIRERITNLSQQLASLSEQVSSNQASAAQLAEFEKRLKSTEEGITSFDAFRRTVNRDLLQLKQVKP